MSVGAVSLTKKKIEGTDNDDAAKGEHRSAWTDAHSRKRYNWREPPFTLPSYERPVVFFFHADDGLRAHCVTGVQTCALPISGSISEAKSTRCESRAPASRATSTRRT